MTTDLLRLGPEIAVSVTLLLLLVVDAVWQRSKMRKQIILWLSVSGLVIAGLALVLDRGSAENLAFGMMAVDGFAAFFRGFALVAGLAAVAFAALSNEIPEGRFGEYLALVLSLTVGLCLLAGAQNLLLVYLAVELVSIPSYVLAGFRRGDRRSSEAALKYVIYGGAASGLMLYGMSWLYGLTGTLDLAQIAPRMEVMGEGWQERLLVVVAALSAFAGFGYKIAAVPFHMWCPDVYEGAPTPFVAYLSVAPKAAGLAALFRFLVVGFGGADEAPGHGLPWPLLVGILSMATMTLGNLVAVVQTNMKRLLAYSSIAHAGYMLMGIAIGTREGAEAVMLYLGVYLLMNFGAFLAVMAVRAETGSESMEDYRGLGRTSPYLAVTLAVFLFSLTGLPPFAGFIGKFYLFAAALGTSEPFFVVLAIVAALNSALSLYYYARIVKVMYLDQQVAAETPRLRVGVGATALLTAFAVPTLVLGIWWAPLATLVASSSLSHP